MWANVQSAAPAAGGGKEKDISAALLLYVVFPAVVAALALVVAKYANDEIFFGRPFTAPTYLVLHNLVEIGSVVVSAAIFFISWCSYPKSGNFRTLVVGSAFLFVAVVDAFHLLSFPGMPSFITESSTDKGIDYWLAARAMQAAVLASIGAVPEKVAGRRWPPILFAAAVTLIIAVFAAVSYAHARLPVFYVPGQGLTTAKVLAEYAIMLAAAAAIVFTFRRSPRLERAEDRLLVVGLLFFVASEFAFTAYASAYDVFNLLGHVFKVASIMLIFVSIFRSSVAKPYEALDGARTEILEMNRGLERRIRARTAELEASKARVQEEKEKLEVMLSSIGDGVIAIDKEWTVTLWNPSAAQISGWSAEESVGQPFRKIVKFLRRSDRTENVLFIADAMMEGKVHIMQDDTVMVRKDGTEVDVNDSAAPIKDAKGRVAGAIIVFRDTTREKGIERAKNDFVSLVTHELRGPASVIKGYLELFGERWGADMGQAQKEYLRNIGTANEKMIELSNALLGVFRVDFGEIVVAPEPVDLTEIAEAALKGMELKIAEKSLTVTKEYDAAVAILNVDRRLIDMAFTDLLSNAVKYTPVGGRVSLAIKGQDGEIRVVVADSGLGIPKDEQEKIFGRFFRARNVRGIDGVGAGLHVLRKMLGRAGCRIWFESEEGKGSTFTIAIPLAGMAKAGT
ncbi:MAG TPA: MASE3 domain-containing protein [Patescibacteria group bacterium]|nr:MASE3 domain-containing protein [Patescibacteria group bacterium]